MEGWDEPHPGRRFPLPASAGQTSSSSRYMPSCQPAASFSTMESQQPCQDRPWPLLRHLRSRHLRRRQPSPGACVGTGSLTPNDAPSLRWPGSSVESVPSKVRMEAAAEREWIEIGAISGSMSEGEGTTVYSSEPFSSIDVKQFRNGSERVVQWEFGVKEDDRRAASAVWECANPYDDIYGWEAEFKTGLHTGFSESKRRKNCKLPLRRSLWRRVFR